MTENMKGSTPHLCRDSYGWKLISLPLISPDSAPTMKYCQEEFQVVLLPTVLAEACPDVESLEPHLGTSGALGFWDPCSAESGPSLRLSISSQTGSLLPYIFCFCEHESLLLSSVRGFGRDLNTADLIPPHLCCWPFASMSGFPSLASAPSMLPLYLAST